jgi:hypothetical protein
MRSPTSPRRAGKCGEGDEHGQGDGRRGRERHGVDEGDAEREQAEEGDDHGEPREQHGASRSGNRLAHCVTRGQVGADHEAAVLVHDEQGVVDAHREPDHQPQGGRRGRHVEVRRQGEGSAHADEHPGEGRQQRKAGGDQRPEGEDEDDGCDHEPEGLMAPERRFGRQQ